VNYQGVFERQDTSVVKWNWKLPNGNPFNFQSPGINQFTKPGRFDVRAIATNSSGCADTVSQALWVHDLPKATIPSPVQKNVGVPVTLPATYTSGIVSYTWKPAATLSCSDCPNPVATPKFNTKYEVSIVDSNGCRNVAEVQVLVFCENANVFIPNTFSPNGDGSNDVFYVRGTGLDRVKSLRIFNRWGQIVFEKRDFPVNDASSGWDGKFNGSMPKSDVYVYQVEVFCENSQIIRYEGNIALIL
jgi:gliding motility-associated-like protein